MRNFKLRKGVISRIERGKVASNYVFQMNPTRLERSWKTNWVDLYAPGTTSGQAMFVNVESQTIKLKLFLAANVSVYRTSADLGVHQELAEIQSWMLPSFDEFLDNQFEYTSPPNLLFTYGPKTWKCTARDMNIIERQHNEGLYPIMAEVDLTLVANHDSFEELRGMIKGQNLDRTTLQL